MKDKGAFSLVEVVLSMVLLATVFAAVMAFVVSLKAWAKGRDTHSLDLEFAAISVLNAEFSKLNYSQRDSIGETVNNSLYDNTTMDISIYRIRPDLSGDGNPELDAPFLAFAVAKDKG